MTIAQSPSLVQIQAAAAWLANHPHQNPDLEMALSLVLQGRIVLHAAEDRVAIAYTSASPQTDIRGIVMARSNNTYVSLASRDRSTAAALFALVESRGCPQRLTASSQVKDWLHSFWLQRYVLQREHHPIVMLCTQISDSMSGDGVARWALPQDQFMLKAYAEAYRAERGSGNLTQNWNELIQRKQVAVVDYEGQIVAVVKRGTTAHHGFVIGTFTFPRFRKRGFARQLLAFFIEELLQDYPAVKLWVDDDNLGAIALYRSLGFQAIGSCYTGYFRDL